MKPEKHQKNTPEESLRASCEEMMGLNLSYNEIRDRLDTTEIARVGKARQAAKTATPAPSAPPRRSVAAVLLVLAVLILTPALAVGSFLIARMSMGDEPPVEEILTDTNGEIVLPPAGEIPTDTNGEIVLPPAGNGGDAEDTETPDEVIEGTETVEPCSSVYRGGSAQCYLRASRRSRSPS